MWRNFGSIPCITGCAVNPGTRRRLEVRIPRLRNRDQTDVTLQRVLTNEESEPTTRASLQSRRDAVLVTTFPRIRLIAAYLGPLPSYFPFFLRSAAANPQVDFLIFSDQRPPASLRGNVRMFALSPKRFEAMASEATGRPMRLINAHKLCDYKPLYGAIFADHLREADYWGHMDLDIIWGNIRKFVEAPIRGGSQIISADGNRLSGAFTVYRNVPKLRDLYRRIANVFDLLNADAVFDLDERNFDAVAKNSGIVCAMQRSYTQRIVSNEELRRFIANEDLYRRVLGAQTLSAAAGGRLPALWRAGETWSFLPGAKPGTTRLSNSMLLHLTTGRVRFSVDAARGLFLPQTVGVSASASSRPDALTRVVQGLV